MGAVKLILSWPGTKCPVMEGPFLSHALNTEASLHHLTEIDCHVQEIERQHTKSLAECLRNSKNEFPS